MTQDQVFVPRTRSDRGLPPLNPDGESLLGASIRKEVFKELHEAIGDSPIGAVLGSSSYLVCPHSYSADLDRNEPLSQLFGWPMYLIRNAASQKRYPSGTNR
jgi:omega-6 fatty acid desaturase (delta-12 desaturase)